MIIAIMVMVAQLFMISSFVGGPLRADAVPNGDVIGPCGCLQTLEATDVGATEATLNGKVSCKFDYASVDDDVSSADDDDGGCTAVRFLYGTDQNDLNKLTKAVIVTDMGPVSVKVSGL